MPFITGCTIYVFIPGIKECNGTYCMTAVHPGKPVCKVRLASTTPRQSHSLCYMGYKVVNPAHRIGGSRPSDCVGVQRFGEKRRGALLPQPCWSSSGTVGFRQQHQMELSDEPKHTHNQCRYDIKENFNSRLLHNLVCKHLFVVLIQEICFSG